MDVNIRDLNEIVRFGNSLKDFLSDYLGNINRIGNAARQDYTTARNCLNTIRTYTEQAKRELDYAEKRLDDAIETARNYPDEDHSDKIEFIAREVEEKRLIYERNRQAFEEAEPLARNVKINTERILEEAQRSRNNIQGIGQTALHSIKKSANAIASYIK